MRFLVLALAVANLVSFPPAMAQPAKWAAKISTTAKGGLLIGNPAAKVKIIEYGSLSCATCARFHIEGLPALTSGYLATGKVSFEFRSFVRNAPDFAGSLLIACLPAKPQLALLDAMFQSRGAWLQPYSSVAPADMQAVASLPMTQQFGRVAELGGLYDWASARGLPAARAKACLADTVLIEKVAANRKEAVETYGLTGTPTFVVDGKPLPSVIDWADLEPMLEAMLR